MNQPNQPNQPTRAQVAAARLRLVLDKKLDQSTPEVVRQIAAMSRPGPTKNDALPSSAPPAQVGEELAEASPASPTSPTSPALGFLSDKDSHLKRLRRIEGQVRGLQRMIDSEVYAVDVLTQLAATVKALQALSISVLEEDLVRRTGEASASEGTNVEETLGQVRETISRFVQSM